MVAGRIGENVTEVKKRPILLRAYQKAVLVASLVKCTKHTIWFGLGFGFGLKLEFGLER